MEDQSRAEEWMAWLVDAGSTGNTADLYNTTEVRWFARGPVPPKVLTWFTDEQTRGSIENRRDSYQLHALNDIGVKRRHGTTLEVKVRRNFGSSVNLGDGLEGRIEEWSRWEPAEDDGAWQLPETPWIDVDKTIYTRSFMPTDREVILPAIHTNRLYAGCDIEVVAVTLGGIDSWSLALKAFGPTAKREKALTSSWRTLVTHSPLAEDHGIAFDRACGYPEWLRLL